MKPTDALPHPLDWQLATLGRAVEVRRGVSWSKDQERDTPREDTVPVLRISNIQEQLDLDDVLHLSGVTERDRTRKLAGEGWSILVGSNGNRNRIGNAVFQSEHTGFLFASFLLAAKPTAESGITPQFFFRWLSNYEVQARISASSEGSTGLSNLSHDFFRAMEIAYPSMSEQQAIVGILDGADRVIERTRAAVMAARRVKRGLIQSLLQRGVKPCPLKSSRIGQLPMHWRAGELRELTDLQVGYTFKSDWFRDTGTFRLLRGENVGYGIPNWNDTRWLAAEKVEYFQEYLLRKDDLIIGMDRPFTKSGFKLTKIGEADVPSLLVQRVGRFLPRSQPTAEFLPVVLQSWSYHKQLIAQQQGTEIPHLSKADILHRLIPIPPEDEQMQIGQIVSACNRLITESENQVQKAERLKRGLMQVLLTGRVRVPVVEEAQQGTRP